MRPPASMTTKRVSVLSTPLADPRPWPSSIRRLDDDEKGTSSAGTPCHQHPDKRISPHLSRSSFILRRSGKVLPQIRPFFFPGGCFHGADGQICARMPLDYL